MYKSPDVTPETVVTTSIHQNRMDGDIHVRIWYLIYVSAEFNIPPCGWVVQFENAQKEFSGNIRIVKQGIKLLFSDSIWRDTWLLHVPCCFIVSVKSVRWLWIIMRAGEDIVMLILCDSAYLENQKLTEMIKWMYLMHTQSINCYWLLEVLMSL